MAQAAHPWLYRLVRWLCGSLPLLQPQASIADQQSHRVLWALQTRAHQQLQDVCDALAAMRACHASIGALLRCSMQPAALPRLRQLSRGGAEALGGYVWGAVLKACHLAAPTRQHGKVGAGAAQTSRQAAATHADLHMWPCRCHAASITAPAGLCCCSVVPPAILCAKPLDAEQQLEQDALAQTVVGLLACMLLQLQKQGELHVPTPPCYSSSDMQQAAQSILRSHTAEQVGGCAAAGVHTRLRVGQHRMLASM